MNAEKKLRVKCLQRRRNGRNKCGVKWIKIDEIISHQFKFYLFCKQENIFFALPLQEKKLYLQVTCMQLDSSIKSSLMSNILLKLFCIIKQKENVIIHQ